MVHLDVDVVLGFPDPVFDGLGRDAVFQAQRPRGSGPVKILFEYRLLQFGRIAPEFLAFARHMKKPPNA
jgi:hypothetical protein